MLRGRAQRGNKLTAGRQCHREAGSGEAERWLPGTREGRSALTQHPGRASPLAPVSTVSTHSPPGGQQPPSYRQAAGTWRQVRSWGLNPGSQSACSFPCHPSRPLLRQDPSIHHSRSAEAWEVPWTFLSPHPLCTKAPSLHPFPPAPLLTRLVTSTDLGDVKHKPSQPGPSLAQPSARASHGEDTNLQT